VSVLVGLGKGKAFQRQRPESEASIISVIIESSQKSLTRPRSRILGTHTTHKSGPPRTHTTYRRASPLNLPPPVPSTAVASYTSFPLRLLPSGLPSSSPKTKKQFPFSEPSNPPSLPLYHTAQKPWRPWTWRRRRTRRRPGRIRARRMGIRRSLRRRRPLLPSPRGNWQLMRYV